MSRPLLCYRAYRHPAFDRAGFVARWRQHGQLGMGQPRWRNIERYVQADALPLDHPGTDRACDGVALVWYRSETHRLVHVADTASGPILKRDELETFDRPVADTAMLIEPTVRRDGDAHFLLFAFLPEPTFDQAPLPPEVTHHVQALRRPDGPPHAREAAIEVIGANEASVLAALAERYAASATLVLTAATLLYAAPNLTSCR